MIHHKNKRQLHGKVNDRAITEAMTYSWNGKELKIGTCKALLLYTKTCYNSSTATDRIYNNKTYNIINRITHRFSEVTYWTFKPCWSDKKTFYLYCTIFSYRLTDIAVALLWLKPRTRLGFPMVISSNLQVIASALSYCIRSSTYF